MCAPFRTDRDSLSNGPRSAANLWPATRPTDRSSSRGRRRRSRSRRKSSGRGRTPSPPSERLTAVTRGILRLVPNVSRPPSWQVMTGDARHGSAARIPPASRGQASDGQVSRPVGRLQNSLRLLVKTLDSSTSFIMRGYPSQQRLIPLLPRGARDAYPHRR
jgi:hypothetical protein